ncbi:Hypp1066 [Branchiostoma lanceolatum]|uniref:Hypp1066 protein n=1 Tax=Branchiostoma lanceolatum TaxID=7740 RepID=A0A8J9ZEC6_BRALA|nr:Hypp1066 [Branchiostoma lanceolatum]
METSEIIKNDRKYDDIGFQSNELSNLTDPEVTRRPQGVYALPFARVSKTVKRSRKEEEDAEVNTNNETFDWDAIGCDESSSFFDNSSTLDDLLGVKSSQRVNRDASTSSKARHWFDRKDLPHPSKLRSSGRDKKRRRRDDNHVQNHVAQLKKKRTDFDCFRLASINARDVKARAKRDSDISVQEAENFQPHTYSVKSTRDKESYRGPETLSPAWSIPGHFRTPGVQQVPTMSPAESNFLQYSTDLEGGSAGNPCFDQASYWTEATQVMRPQQSYHEQHSSDVQSPTCIINPDPLGILATMRQRGPEVFQRFMNLYTEE